MRKKIKILASIISLPVIAVLALLVYGDKNIPGEFIIAENTPVDLGYVFSLKENKENAEKRTAAVNLSGNGSAPAEEAERLAQVKLFGTFPVKTAKITAGERRYVTVSGEIFGLRIYSDGLIVVGVDKVETEEGIVSPAEISGLKTGDIIKSVNGKEMKRVNEFTRIIEKSEGREVSLKLLRDGRVIELGISPAIASFDGKYKAGLWLRDSSAGIGTMTFYDGETGVFGGLGHAVCDVDTMGIIPLSGGDALNAVINGCYKGSNGATGELCGVFGSEKIGSLIINGSSGVYGRLNRFDKDAKSLPVASRQEIKPGPAQIISTVDNNGPAYYDIEIIKINLAADTNERNMTIEIKDEGLISKTGGIVQGMSGSPIVQDGYFVGAVTHVFLNNCLQGYGIFAENMMKTCDETALLAA